MEMFRSYYESPIGLILVEGGQTAVTHINFREKTEYDSNPNCIIDKCIKQLDEYFKGLRRAFDIPVETVGTPFQKKVWASLTEIEYGKTASYQDIAIKAGNIKACRAVGAVIGKNPISIVLPCHRVIGKNGALTGFAGGLERKKWLLMHEKNNSITF